MTDFKSRRMNVKHFKEIKRFSLQKAEAYVFRTQASICDGAFLWLYLTAY